jgi:hypothetical protein
MRVLVDDEAVWRPSARTTEDESLYDALQAQVDELAEKVEVQASRFITFSSILYISLIP